MAKRTVFESTNMASTKYAERILDAIAEEDIENGTFGYLGELAEGEEVTYNFIKGAVAGKQIVVVDNPAWDPDTCRIENQRKDKYIIPAGTRFRVRVIKLGDNFGITAEGITPETREILKGEDKIYLTIDATGKLIAKTSATEGALMEAEVERKRKCGATLVTNVRTYGYSNIMYEAKVKTLA